MARLLKVAEVSDMTGISQNTLRYWRYLGDVGPKSFKLGPRRVVYDEADVLAWIDEQKRLGHDAAPIRARRCGEPT